MVDEGQADDAPFIVSKELMKSDEKSNNKSPEHNENDQFDITNPFQLKPENNVLFPDSKQTDIEIIGESIGKIG